MKYFLISLLLCGTASAQMLISQVQVNSVSPLTVSLNAPAPANSLIVIGYGTALSTGSLTSLTGGGLTFTKAAGSNTRLNTEIWYAVTTSPLSSGTSFTAVFASRVLGSVSLANFTGIDPSTLNVSGGSNSGTSATMASASVTSLRPKSIVFACSNNQLAPNSVPTNSFVSLPVLTEHIRCAYLFVTPGVYSTSWSRAIPLPWESEIALFEGPPGTIVSPPPPPTGAPQVTTQHNDNLRTGVNSAETILNQSNVSSTTFGKKFSMVVEGQVYAQPLYVPGVSIAGIGIRNVIFVATQLNNVYAFDADNYVLPPGAKVGFGTQLWTRNLGTPVLCSQIVNCDRDIVPSIGITSTPVIDVGRGTIYVVSENLVSAPPLVARFMLHALDLTTGAEKRGSPVVISGSVTGTGYDAVGNVITFNAAMHWQRPALTLVNGNVYIAFAGHQDTDPYHGWIMGYDGSSLRQVVVKCLTPNSARGGIWQSGAGFVADASNNLYAETGNGGMTASTGGIDYGMSTVKLNALGGLGVTGFFSPSNEAVLDASDQDFGSTGPLMIPGTNYLVASGKDGRSFVLDINNMGGFDNTADKVVQEWYVMPAFFNSPVFWNNNLYTWGRSDFLKMWTFTGNPAAVFNTTPAKTGTILMPSRYQSSAAMSITTNGATPGSGILWTTNSKSETDGQAWPQIVHAFSADDVSIELWNSDQNFTRDDPGSWSKFSPPTVAGGQLFVPTFDGKVNVYGLLQ